jgi:hypothetical protein
MSAFCQKLTLHIQPDYSECTPILPFKRRHVMNLEQFSYLADITGVIAIIASLIYVARQINQNTQTLQINAGTAIETWGSTVMLAAATDREFAEVWNKGDSQFKDLDQVDQSRLLLFEMSGIARFAHFFALREQGVLPETNWQMMLWSFEMVGKRQSMREAWKSLKDSYDPRFAEALNPYLGGGS